LAVLSSRPPSLSPLPIITRTEPTSTSTTLEPEDVTWGYLTADALADSNDNNIKPEQTTNRPKPSWGVTSLIPGFDADETPGIIASNLIDGAVELISIKPEFPKLPTSLTAFLGSSTTEKPSKVTF
jgi:hypothetical protein